MTATSGKNTPSDQLRQVVGYILDTSAMAAAIESLLDAEMTASAREMPEIEARFPGFSARLRRQIGKEVRRTISHRVSGLRDTFEDLLGARLAPDDIKVALEFQRDRLVAQLRDSAFVKSLETDGRSNARLSERMAARMSSEQHAVVERFLQSPCGRKLAPLTRRMESLKFDWMQGVASEISQRLPSIGSEILQKHYTRRTSA